MFANQSYAMAKGVSCLEGVSALIVEPDSAVAEVLAFMLEAEGAEVQIAHTLKAAIATFSQHQPSLVLCNLKLPDGEGYSLLHHCQNFEHSADQSIAAIAIADSPWKVDRQKALSSGFHQYLFEPTEYSSVMSAIAGVLEKKWQLRRYSLRRTPS